MIWLTIKKCILLDIINGKKRYEYRSFSTFYKKRFDKKPANITFFFYSKERVIIQIKKIEIIKTPIGIGDYVKTKKCFRISLGSIIKNTLK